jgi:glycerol-3-phosphate dehydrogenase
MGGLKRRTRAMMGRCQGFYCSAPIADITKGRFDGKP